LLSFISPFNGIPFVFFLLKEFVFVSCGLTVGRLGPVMEPSATTVQEKRYNTGRSCCPCSPPRVGAVGLGPVPCEERASGHKSRLRQGPAWFFATYAEVFLLKGKMSGRFRMFGYVKAFAAKTMTARSHRPPAGEH